MRRAGVEHLMREGGEALWDGQILEAVADEKAWARRLVRAAHAVDGHARAAYGALELVIDDAPPPLETPAAAATEGCP
ncbi:MULTISPECIES: hypothetical protein [Sorangium]|uniref:Uncharacterized protein n=1 Tax=Sorangium cellulosum TaxID=56 RepID=A0A4P2R4A8_SORCE|nr:MULTISPECIES: hypothetical protein [Sorangium]AUX37451.1 uncharacterized protein SOCE836_096750 [Sorangium cellulosum]WCQ96740.1 hypothetical protein NQZ70_09527 [Sorangium sp. Soce836]